ncbi:pseudouridine synthase [Thaumasiovibrio sp. DFM-14]|uniref:pseudouridine synthase n=1 Tax=Thaumasiovibrio sp. DFM-14 TaxID=3384792 RepID=UPI00399F9375
MPSSTAFFSHFKQNIQSIPLPERFTFPYYYDPHPLCLLAVEELQQHLMAQTDWEHDFSLVCDHGSDNVAAGGKMFGVLLGKDKSGEIGYLTGFAGTLAGEYIQPGFVPPVFDTEREQALSSKHGMAINQLNAAIDELENQQDFAELSKQLRTETDQAEREIEAERQRISAAKRQRKALRDSPAYDQDFALRDRLAKESSQEKRAFKTLKQQWLVKVEALTATLNARRTAIDDLKAARTRAINNALEERFKLFRFRNAAGEVKHLDELMSLNHDVIASVPSGLGECVVPKLLNHAFLHDITPLAITEFWWGASPKDQIRQHKNFYPVCQSKCFEILSHMLEGIETDDSPLIVNPAQGRDLEIIYEDSAMVIVNKPAEFLSVPGKSITDSVYSRIKARYPDATGPLIVHRLDMSTSGLLVLALSVEANKIIQQQFINRTVSKRYVALLEGHVEPSRGKIALPIRGDIGDRPRQMVCFTDGKPAETTFEVIERKNNRTKVYLYPKTGRTHQLRVHCAHIDGLNMPIVGDDLYGYKSTRLHLHAEQLSLRHPVTNEKMTFQVDAEF